MRADDRSRPAWRLRWLLVGALAVAGLAPSAAHAGTWIQVSCVNPNGSGAPSQGWTNIATGSPEPGSNASTNCAPGSPMQAFLSAQAPAPVAIANIGTSEGLQYTPPSTSMLVGGSLDANLYGDGYGPIPNRVNQPGSGETGSGDAVVFTPDFAFGGDNIIFMCAWEASNPCSSGPDPAAYSGPITIPPNRGGDLYVAAACGGDPQGGECDQNSSENAWSYAQVVSADLLLFNSSSPAASGFGGSLLSPSAKGTADVSFTATDAGGPGVFNVTVQIDGHNLYSGTPDTDSGHCVAVGSDSTSGALMFDWQQPCPASEFVDVPVDTAGLGAGQHELRVSVSDAAQNTSTVLDQTIGTGTTTTPTRSKPAHHVRAKLLIGWEYNGAHTRLIRVRARNLPQTATIAVGCSGAGCPPHNVITASAAHAGRLWKALGRQVFTAGDRETFTITAPGLLPERVQLLIRSGSGPIWKLL